MISTRRTRVTMSPPRRRPQQQQLKTRMKKMPKMHPPRKRRNPSRNINRATAKAMAHAVGG